MDNLFRTRVLTAAVNEMRTPQTKIYDRFFRPKERFSPTDAIAFDIIYGSERILSNLKTTAAAQVTDKTYRKTVTMEAPRLATKRSVSAAELNRLRGYGAMAPELLKDRIAREQMDMVGEIDRTKEFWAANAIKGKIYDADVTTVLVDYNLDSTHNITLTSTDLWTDFTNSDPINRLRLWKKLIEDDSGAVITGWMAYMGYEVMDALLGHTKIRDLLKYNAGVQIAETGRITKLVDVEMEEYNGSYVNGSGTRTRFIASDEIVLIGMCQDITDCQYAPVMDLESGQGVGNVTAAGVPQPFFSKSWTEPDPSVTWIKAETRPLPVLQRPGAVIRATVV